MTCPRLIPDCDCGAARCQPLHLAALAVVPPYVVPPAVQGVLPDDVVLILREKHDDHVQAGEKALYWAAMSFFADSAKSHAGIALDRSVAANAIVAILRRHGHHADADALRDRAAELERALLDGGVG